MFAFRLYWSLLTVFDLVELWHIGVGAFISGVLRWASCDPAGDDR